ncbi:MAG: RNA polymerase factor sigma-54 [Selenomonas sp.]|uniref:RNA polymerase factor sigma-54 n=1 Tax=Selenomonas sp. TaxID=2053611 RepID=UPI0025DC12A5|nr:RNA polymerase factor sigma-54 [Selenomonas sp.]MCR5438466.1 RNA polymerase factor sigma-54 [Selenomonas sp.]
MQAEQSLNLNLSQHLAMTVKLQQAIRILQLSAQDLRSEIEKEYLENPALEIDYGDAAPAEGNLLQAENMSRLTDYLGEGGSSSGYYGEDAEPAFEAAESVSLTLEEELLDQVKFAFPHSQERAIAVFIVGSLDNNGYLTLPLAEIARAMAVETTAVEAVLRQVQEFEPAGVAARDLPECLRIQAKRQGIYQGLVAAIIDRYLDEVAESQIKKIAAAEQCRPQDVQAAVDIVRQLDPKPGAAYGGEKASFITPDVLVQEVDGVYRITLNDNYIPQLRISAAYQHAESFDAETRKYITKRLNAAAWLINSIEQRRTTIRQVVEEILNRQPDFLTQGMKGLHPMAMKDVADAIGVHESTVSRAVANKYAQFPQGIVALRKFFTANLAKNGSEEDFAAVQAKEAIAELIKGEDPHKPLSDQKLCELLKARKMDISRRTVMKYREQLGYPSSVKRKRY